MEEAIDELFPTTSEPVRDILAQVRGMVRDSLPDATEIFYHGSLGYGPTASGFDRILYVAPQNGYVNLGFFYGTEIPDPQGLLEGSGRRMRHTKIKSVLAAQNPALIPLVREAWKLGVIAVTRLHETRKTRHKGLTEG
ncbi:MAG TPA: DUF1801 domain-containing protein [Ktedonobacterales bacterium]